MKFLFIFWIFGSFLEIKISKNDFLINKYNKVNKEKKNRERERKAFSLSLSHTHTQNLPPTSFLSPLFRLSSLLLPFSFSESLPSSLSLPCALSFLATCKIEHPVQKSSSTLFAILPLKKRGERREERRERKEERGERK